MDIVNVKPDCSSTVVHLNRSQYIGFHQDVLKSRCLQKMMDKLQCLPIHGEWFEDEIKFFLGLSANFNLCDDKASTECCHVVRDCLFNSLAKYTLQDTVFAYIVQIAHDVVCQFRQKMADSNRDLCMSVHFETVANLIDSYDSVFSSFYF